MGWLWQDVRFGVRTILKILATIATAVVSAVIFGLAPALTASRRDLNEPLKTGGRGNTGFQRGRLRNILIVSEVALSLLLISGAGASDA